MSKDILQYLASKSAIRLWLLLTFTFFMTLIVKLSNTGDKLGPIQLILFTTDILHFWIPIFAGRYLYRIRYQSRL